MWSKRVHLIEPHKGLRVQKLRFVSQKDDFGHGKRQLGVLEHHHGEVQVPMTQDPCVN